MASDQVNRTRWVSVRALRAAAGRVSVWSACWAAMVLLALVAATPWAHWFDRALDHSYAPGSLVGSLDAVFRFDQRAALDSMRDSTAQLGAGLALLAILWGVFSAGGWLRIFIEAGLEGGKDRSLRRFLGGGAGSFWRFFRVLLLTLVLLSLAGWLAFGWPWKTLVLDFLLDTDEGNLEVLASESSALSVGWVQTGLYSSLVALILVWADYTRTRLAYHGTRSTVWAGLCTCGLFFRAPVRSLRPMILLLAAEALVLWGIGSLVWEVNTGLDGSSGSWSILQLLLASQVALAWRIITRGARYRAALTVTRELVGVPDLPDPWAGGIGGPGGPQYPVGGSEDSDEYAVVL